MMVALLMTVPFYLTGDCFFFLFGSLCDCGRTEIEKKGTAGDKYSVTGTNFCLLSRATAQPTLDAFVSATGPTQTL